MNILCIAIGSALGGLSRHYVGVFATNAGGNPTLATVVINVVGSFAIGLFLVLSIERSWPTALVLFVAVGFLGGFTTFSTFSWQSYQLLEAGDIHKSILNMGASVFVGLLAVWTGATVAKAV